MAEPELSPKQNTMATNDDRRITYFGLTDSRNEKIPFGIRREDRSRHMYVIGKTGMGKSTLLENMAAQDILNGEGMCFIDPHGGSADKLLNYIPENRVKDVLNFAPFDMEYPISFNVLENVDADKRHLVVAGLMSTFEKIWVDAWSARMAYILQNTIGALLEFPGATLLSVNRMYIDKEYRKNVIAKITDPSVRSFWVDEYSKYTDRYAQEATPAIQNKIGQFASNALVRNVIGQPQSSFNIRELMDEGKIFIVNLSKGRVGEGNANLLGSMLITKIYLAAMSRADTHASEMHKLPPFYLYVDEFQNFANKSFADILSEARKYKLALTVAHQYIEQMEDEVRAAVFGNVGTMMTFRVGAYDAEVLEKEFAPTFTAEDLVNLGARQIYLKLMIDGVSSQPFSAVTMPPVPEPEINHGQRAIAFSRGRYSKPRAEVEKNISDWVGQVFEDPEKDAKEAARLERRAQRDEGEKNQNSAPPAPRTRMESHPPRPERNHSAPRPPFPKKPPAPEDKKDLRELLAKMATTEKKIVTQPEIKKNDKNVVRLPPVVQVPKKFVPRDDGKGVTDKGKEELRKLLSSLVKDQPATTPISPTHVQKQVVQSETLQEKGKEPVREQPTPAPKEQSTISREASTKDTGRITEDAKKEHLSGGVPQQGGRPEVPSEPHEVPKEGHGNKGVPQQGKIKEIPKEPREVPREKMEEILHVTKPNF